MKISEYFKLNKTQYELDFIDIDIEHDIPLFIDPFVFKFKNDNWAIDCNNQIVDFFDCVLKNIKSENYVYAKNLLNSLSEPKETHLGYSKNGTSGKGVSGKQSVDFFEALKKSKAVKSGVLSDISDCELMIQGISVDKISDITTNIIRDKLIEYTQDQCQLLNIEVIERPSGKLWSATQKKWLPGIYVKLPVINGQTFLLVPKHIVVYKASISSQEFYNHDVLDFIKDEHLNNSSSLVEVLKNGKRRVTKKALKESPDYKMSKEFLYNFCDKYPKVLEKYKKRKNIVQPKNIDFFDIREEDLANELIEQLNSIKSGAENATDFHNYCIGVLEFIFYLQLIYPKKEVEIHEGRKRIDITFNNGSKDGLFFDLKNNGKIASSLVMIECKNYSHEIANPELDQITGRFSNIRGWFGIIIARNFDDRDKFIKRCKDTAKDGRGIVIPLCDDDIKIMLQFIIDGERSIIDNYLNDIYQLIIS